MKKQVFVALALVGLLVACAPATGLNPTILPPPVYSAACYTGQYLN
jgi:hypothetical protein